MENTQPLGPPPPPPQPKPPSRKSGKRTWLVQMLIGLLAILAGVTIFLLMQNQGLSDVKEGLEEQQTNLQAELRELDKKMAEMDGALSDAQLDNQRKQDMIKKLDDEVTYLKVRLQRAMKEGKMTAEDRDVYKGKYEQLEFYNRRYRQKIAELETLIAEQGVQISRLSDEKDSLSQANTKLEDRNLLNELKIQVGSKLAANDLQIYGVNSRGKEFDRERLNRRRTRALKSCVGLMQNNIAEVGKRSLYLVVLQPDGKVLHHPQQGSGYYSSEEGEKPYTARAVVDYKRKAITGCAVFELPADVELEPGVHKIIWYTAVSESSSEFYELGRTQVELR